MSDDNDEDNEVDGSLTILKSQQSKERKEMKGINLKIPNE